MIIPKITNRIHKCLEIAESINLTNKEEENLTLELTYYFKKLIVHLLTKKEKENYKRKIKLIADSKNLNKLFNRLYKKEAYSFNKSISLKSNLMLFFFPKSYQTTNIIYKEFTDLFNSSNNLKKSSTFYVLNLSKTIINSYKIKTKLYKFFEQKHINSLVIEAYDLIKLEKKLPNLQEFLSINIKNNLILKVKNEDEILWALDFLKGLNNLSPKLEIGLSINIINKNLVRSIYKNIEAIKTLNNFTFRLCKRYEKSNKNQLLKNNTFYKWATYSIIQIARKSQIRLLIQSHNIHDISWLIIIRAQLNLENKISFEINISKHPNIAKILMIINKSNIQSQVIFLDKKKEIIKIIIEKLSYQAMVYQIFKKSPYNISHLFIKSHRQFFNYLRRNYVKLFLNKNED